ncbi:MAG: hypothetical protein ABR972_10810 [Acidimicrobiales bacterium]|jgi:hypothetical protein
MNPRLVRHLMQLRRPIDRDGDSSRTETAPAKLLPRIITFVPPVSGPTAAQRRLAGS